MGKTANSMVRNKSQIDWETLLTAASIPIARHREKFSTKPLPYSYTPAPRKAERTDCEHLEVVPFKAHCFCNRLHFPKIVHEADCKRCRNYSPKSPA